MKIGIDGRMYGAISTTGIGVYIQRLTDELFNIDQNNEYYLLLSDLVFEKFSPPHERIKKIKAPYPWYSWSEQFHLPKLLNSLKLDLVHFPHFNVPIWYSGKYLVTIHDITPKFFPGPRVKKSVVRRLGFEVVFNRGIKKAKKIITVSQHTKNLLLKHFKVQPEKIEVIYPGVDVKFGLNIDQDKIKEIKKRYSITKPFIFYVGVWRDHKNLPGLIEAFNLLKSKFRLDYQLVLGGQADPRYPEIAQAIDKSVFKSDIIAPGFIAEEELPLFYQAADLFVLPSFAEGFGLVAVESLACGTPVVGSNTTSLPEVLDQAGAFFNPHDTKEMAGVINQILTDQPYRQNLINQGKIILTRYSWEKCAKDVLNLYQSLG